MAGHHHRASSGLKQKNKSHKTTKSNRAQKRASGAGRLAYWAAHYAWDFAGHALLTLCLLLVYAQYAASSSKKTSCANGVNPSIDPTR